MRTDTMRIPVIDGEVDDTVEFTPPWLRPPATSVYVTPRAQLASRLRTVAASPFAADVRRGWEQARLVLGAFGIAFTFLLVVRGAHAAADMAGLIR